MDSVAEMRVENNRGRKCWFEKLRRSKSASSGSLDQTFLLVVEQHRASVSAFLYRLLGDSAAAERVLEEALLDYYRDGCRETEDPLGRFCAYALARIQRTTLAPKASKKNDLRQRFDRLPLNARAAVLLHKFHQFSVGRIAAVIGSNRESTQELLVSTFAELSQRHN